MARRGRATSRMEKSVQNGVSGSLGGGTPALVLPFQLDSGEVEAQVKRIMLSFGEYGAAKSAAFKLGLFQFSPSITDFNEDEAIVLSGAIGNQFSHNDTITMRVPKDWYIALLLEQLDPANTSELTWSAQFNYKVLN